MEVSQLYHIFQISSETLQLILKLKHLRKHFTKALIPQNLLTNVAKFANNIFVRKPIPKLELRIVLPYLGKTSSITKKRLKRYISKRLKFCKLKINFQTFNWLKNCFRFKARVSETLQSKFVNKFKCRSFTAFYYDKTYKNMKVLVSEHRNVSPRTGKEFKGTLSTSVRDHMLNCDHAVAWEDICIIGIESSQYLLETKESLYIKRQNPSLNRNKYSQELFLF